MTILNSHEPNSSLFNYIPNNLILILLQLVKETPKHTSRGIGFKSQYQSSTHGSQSVPLKISPAAQISPISRPNSAPTTTPAPNSSASNKALGMLLQSDNQLSSGSKSIGNSLKASLDIEIMKGERPDKKPIGGTWNLQRMNSTDSPTLENKFRISRGNTLSITQTNSDRRYDNEATKANEVIHKPYPPAVLNMVRY